jgi:hypothetical protein
MRNLPGGIAKIWSAGKRPWARGLVFLLVFVLIMAGLPSIGSNYLRPATATLQPGQVEVTPTLPAYLGQDINQMTPIILGGALLVLIILAGTIYTSRRQT